MGRTTSWKDEFTLLCERCGYVVEGLDVGGACPECGKAIVESLPERRVGSLWQIQPNEGTLLRTTWMTVFQPNRTLDMLSPHASRDQLLKRIYIFGAAFPAGIIISFGLHGGIPLRLSSIPFPAGFFIILTFLCVLICAGGFSILTAVETHGLIFLSNRHGTRVSRSFASSITAHGCIGWVVSTWTTSIFLVGSSVVFGGIESDWVWILVLISGVCAASGFLFFETFAWLGLRRCKYANRARPGGVEGGEPPAVAS